MYWLERAPTCVTNMSKHRNTTTLSTTFDHGKSRSQIVFAVLMSTITMIITISMHEILYVISVTSLSGYEISGSSF